MMPVPVGSVVAPSTAGAARGPHSTSFGDALKAATAQKAPAPDRNSALHVNLERGLRSLTTAQTHMDRILKAAESGHTFSPSQLLALQARVYQASQHIDLATKLVEKGTGGLKQVLQTQI